MRGDRELIDEDAGLSPVADPDPANPLPVMVRLLAGRLIEAAKPKARRKRAKSWKEEMAAASELDLAALLSTRLLPPKLAEKARRDLMRKSEAARKLAKSEAWKAGEAERREAAERKVKELDERKAAREKRRQEREAKWLGARELMMGQRGGVWIDALAREGGLSKAEAEALARERGMRILHVGGRMAAMKS